MKIVVFVLLSLTALVSCNESPSKTPQADNVTTAAKNDSTDKIALHQLFSKLEKLPNVKLSNNEIQKGDTSIQLSVEVEVNDQKDSRWIYAANFKTVLTDGTENRINVGSIGIGSSKEEAVDVCIQEWFAAFGVPFTNMLNNEKSVTVAGMKVFPGLMGIRGQLPENTWLKGDDYMTNKIISQLQEEVKAVSARIIPIDIKLMIGNGGVVNGECRIGNEVSAEVFSSLKKLDWPSAQEPFMLKQFYLIEKK
jgi:hypothetical protein